MSVWPPEVTLSRNGIALVPLALGHEAGLRAAAADGELWNIRVTSVPAPGDERKYIEQALEGRKQGVRQPFAVIDEASGRVLGTTSYHDILPAVKRVEIGYTWYAKSVQRSHVNTTCKLMLMAHAFETLQCPVVGWRTDIFNFNSQRAIEKLGARREGVLLRHGLRRDGTTRDTVMYSMLASDWPAVREKLKQRLSGGGFSSSKPGAVPLVSFGEITANNLIDFLKLSPGASGERFVARNAVTLAQAAFSAQAANAVVRGVFVDGKPAGLFMLYDPSRQHSDEKPVDALYIWRFMVDLQHQRSGVGSAMMREVLRMAQANPSFNAITLSYNPIEGSPKPFYEKFGFRDTGEIDDDENVMRLSMVDAARHLKSLRS